MDAECFSKDILAAAELAASAGKPFLLTEYKEGLHGGPGTGFGGSHSDRAYAAAFVMHTVPLLSRLEAVSWWTFSDIFEENWMIGRRVDDWTKHVHTSTLLYAHLRDAREFC